MDFQLNEDQLALRAGIRSFCDGRLSLDALRELEKQGFDRALWGELAEMGVFSLRQREDTGGVGLGTARAIVLAETTPSASAARSRSATIRSGQSAARSRNGRAASRSSCAAIHAGSRILIDSRAEAL